ncbi:MAG: carbohydrate ABC transporter permease [Verrucomicrobia bacterium]|nr:carbohydrate ABC transporter permease [Verrucomicrobiota bacterium]MCH8510412.1 carbohydrate ABC transporter permease [Kiritimatiellia bacterium]
MNTIHITLVFLVAIYGILRWGYPRKAEIASGYLRYVLLGIAAFLILCPFVWLVCAVFKDKDVLMQYTFLPAVSDWSTKTLNFNNFRALFAGEDTVQGRVYFQEYVINSLFLASTATSINLFFASMGGYALSKYEFRGRQGIMAFMIGSMMFPSMLFLAPVYRMIFAFGWMDTYLALLVPGACSVFGMFLFRQSMTSVPDSLIEAARIDGASEFGIYFNIIMPLVRPITGAFCLITFLGSWNSFIGPQVFIQTQSKLTLPVVLNQYMGVYTQQYGVFLAGTLLAIIPPAVLFFALQKEFVSGLTSGGVKG